MVEGLEGLKEGGWGWGGGGGGDDVLSNKLFFLVLNVLERGSGSEVGKVRRGKFGRLGHLRSDHRFLFCFLFVCLFVLLLLLFFILFCFLFCFSFSTLDDGRETDIRDDTHTSCDFPGHHTVR